METEPASSADVLFAGEFYAYGLIQNNGRFILQADAIDAFFGGYFATNTMKEISYVVFREGDFFYVAPCLNGEVSSFGETIDEATKNLRKAVKLNFSDEPIADGIVELGF